MTLLESSSDTSSQNDSSLNRIYATDRLTGEQLLLESDHVIVATDPETAKALLRDGELCCVVLFWCIMRRTVVVFIVSSCYVVCKDTV